MRLSQKHIKLILPLLLLAVISGCAHKPRPVAVNNVNEQVATTTVNIIEATSTVDVLDTSNWKTYRNEEYGFEMKYPVSFVELEFLSEKVTWYDSNADSTCIGADVVNEKEYHDQLNLKFYRNITESGLTKRVMDKINDGIFSYSLEQGYTTVKRSSFHYLNHFGDAYGAATNYLRLFYSPQRHVGISLEYRTMCHHSSKYENLIDDMTNSVLIE